MLRILGGILVLLGCSGLGFWYRWELNEGLKHMRQICKMLEMMMSEVNYHRSTLPECCRQVGKNMEEPYKSSLMKIYELMEGSKEQDFRAGWHQIMGECLKSLPISQKEKEMVLGFASEEGISDYHMQLRTIEQHRDMINSSVKKRECELQKQGRMAAGLGIMCGLLIVVILL
ncbi:MAG: stage III sporulation protein AB [Lachnospiraceae bacterium]|nr:stage III sporulation protein AB [Lachnospiraceae bacterium]